jgi:tetratricopeptide (TPR) repeat protein
MTFKHKLAQLIGYYVCGPLLGIHQHLIVPDVESTEPELFITWIFLALLAGFLVVPWLSPLVRFALILTVTPVVVYSWCPVPQIVLEYRAYLATAGMALLITYLGQTHSLYVLLPTVIFFACRTLYRNGLFTNSERFWRKATTDSPDPGVMSNYFYQLNQMGQHLEVERIYSTLKTGFSDCRTLLINLAAAKVGSGQVADPDKLAEARDILLEVTRRWPAECDGWRNLATVQFCLGEFQHSVRSSNRAVGILPDDGLSWLCKGQSLSALNRHAEAVGCLKRAFELLPEHFEQVRYKLMEELEAAGLTRELKEHQRYLADKSIIFVTEDMLPDWIRNRVVEVPDPHKAVYEPVEPEE